MTAVREQVGPLTARRKIKEREVPLVPSVLLSLPRSDSVDSIRRPAPASDASGCVSFRCASLLCVARTEVVRW